MKYNPEKHHRRSIRLKGYDYTSAGAYFITICTHQRLCLLGDIAEGEMQLNEIGKMVDAYWQRLPFHFPNVQLDAYVVMPNHIHGILVLIDPPRRGAALGQDSTHLIDPGNPNATPTALGQDSTHLIDPGNPNATPTALGQDSTHLSDPGNPNATPIPDPLSEPGVAFGQLESAHTRGDLPNAAPLRSNAAPLRLRLDAGSVGAMVLNFKSVTTRSFNRIRRSPGTRIWQRNYYDHIIRSEESLHRIRQYIHQNPMSWYQDQLHPTNPSKW